MPKPRRSNQSLDGQFSISFKTLGAIGTGIAIIVTILGTLSRVATKEDVHELALTYDNSYKALEVRVRNVEVQLASFFGKAGFNGSPSIFKPSSEDEVIQPSGLILVKGQSSYPTAQSYQPPPKRVVLTLDFIKSHELQPTRGGMYLVLGADGQFYGLDDVLAVIIREHDSQEMQNRYKRMK